VSSPAASNASWSELNALYEENVAASYQAIQNAYADVALLSPPNSPDFLFPRATPDYIYNPLLIVEERNATPPFSPIPYALLELAEEALCCQQLEEEDGSPLPSLQYPPLEAFILDEEIPVEELPPPQVITPVAVVPSPAPESPVLHGGPTSAILPTVEPTVLQPHQLVDKSPVIPPITRWTTTLTSSPPCPA
jgi:hypothetical protein